MFSDLYFKHSLLNCRLKSKEMPACLQNCRFYRSIISNYSSEVKWKLIENLSKIIQIKRLFCSWLTLRKRHILRLRRLVIPLLIKNVDYLLQLVGIYSNLLCNLQYAWCLRNVQILRGFDFIELIYKLFDNPSYDYVLTRYSGNTRHSFPYVSGNVSS